MRDLTKADLHPELNATPEQEEALLRLLNKYIRKQRWKYRLLLLLVAIPLNLAGGYVNYRILSANDPAPRPPTVSVGSEVTPDVIEPEEK